MIKFKTIQNGVKFFYVGISFFGLGGGGKKGEHFVILGYFSFTVFLRFFSTVHVFTCIRVVNPPSCCNFVSASISCGDQ